MSTYFIGSSDITVALLPPDAMALFTPEGERSWAGKDGWSPQYPGPLANRRCWRGVHHPTPGAPDDLGYREPRAGPYSLRPCHANGLAGTVEVRVPSGSQAGTTVRVTYDLTALTDAAIDELAGFAVGYHAEIDTWASDIAESLARRGSAPPAVARAGGADKTVEL